jgi:3-phytase
MEVVRGRVSASVGTEPVKGGADGVAVWVDRGNPGRSVVIGARPSKGLAVFSLDGKTLQVVDFPKGGAGEVDVRYGFPLGDGTKIDIAAGGVKYGRSLYVYAISSDGRLRNVLAEPVKTRVKPYGSCLYHSAATGKYYLFITSKSGRIEQYELLPADGGMVRARFVRIIPFELKGDPVVEACVCDDEKGFLYFSQENECRIWRCRAEPGTEPDSRLVDNARIAPGDNVEGLAIYKPEGGGNGYLVASIQGSWKYKVYGLGGSYPLLAVFDIETADGEGLVQSHDCIETVSESLGGEYASGLLVTQNANHKGGYHYQIVPWSVIAEKLRLE